DNAAVANVDIAYSTDGGATYPNVIASGVANSGSYPWTVPMGSVVIMPAAQKGMPHDMVTSARMRVTAHDTGSMSGSDAHDFTIRDPEITASAGANGTITPSGTVAVPYGTDQAFAIAANSGYYIQDVLVDGSSVGPVSAYTFTNVTADHTISASF